MTNRIFFLIFSLFVFSHLQAEPLKVVIIGGGPAGLSAAIEAKEKGAEVTVVEKRSPYTREQIVLLRPSSLNLLEKWKVVCPEIKSFDIQDKKEGVVQIKHLENALAQRVKELGVEILNAEFNEILDGKAYCGDFLLPYDILIGADGTHSKVRECTSIVLNNYGEGIGIGTILFTDLPNSFSVDTVQINGIHMRRITVPKFSFVFAQTPNLSQEISTELIALSASQSGWPLEASLIEQSAIPDFLNCIEVKLQQVDSFYDEKKKIILIGDAAATASFFEGLGANTALKSATLIGDFVLNHDFECFNTEMQDLTDKLINSSRYLFD